MAFTEIGIYQVDISHSQQTQNIFITYFVQCTNVIQMFRVRGGQVVARSSHGRQKQNICNVNI